MRVVYEKTVVKKIKEAAQHAKSIDKTISYIVLTEREMEEFKYQVDFSPEGPGLEYGTELFFAGIKVVEE